MIDSFFHCSPARDNDVDVDVVVIVMALAFFLLSCEKCWCIN